MKHRTNNKNKAKKVKSDNYIQGAIEKIPILLSQYLKKIQHNNYLPILGVPIIISLTV